MVVAFIFKLRSFGSTIKTYINLSYIAYVFSFGIERPIIRCNVFSMNNYGTGLRKVSLFSSSQMPNSDLWVSDWNPAISSFAQARKNRAYTWLVIYW